MLKFIVYLFCVCLIVVGIDFAILGIILKIKQIKIKKYHRFDEPDKAADLLKGSVSDDTYKR